MGGEERPAPSVPEGEGKVSRKWRGAPLFGERVQVHLILASSLSEAAEVMKTRREIVQALEYRIWWVNWQFLAQMRLIGLRAAILYKASRYPSAFDPAILDENLPLNCTSHVRMHELYYYDDIISKSGVIIS
jgi:hypothetical protein